MQEKRIPQGLCINCIHADSCTIAMNAVKPVSYCNEHDIIIDNFATDSHPVPLMAAIPAQEPNETAQNGICSNCENQAFCGFTKETSVVWQCAEYV